jgi:hypothetical protein
MALLGSSSFDETLWQVLAKMHLSDEVFYELLQENEYSDISKNEYSSDSEINENSIR